MCFRSKLNFNTAKVSGSWNLQMQSFTPMANGAQREECRKMETFWQVRNLIANFRDAMGINSTLIQNKLSPGEELNDSAWIALPTSHSWGVQLAPHLLGCWKGAGPRGRTPEPRGDARPPQPLQQPHFPWALVPSCGVTEKHSEVPGRLWERDEVFTQIRV